jgi:hypothetical protein
MVDFHMPVKKRLLPQDLPEPVPSFVLDDDSLYCLYVRDTVANSMREYANLYPSIEVGGVLFGRHYMSGNRTVVVIEHHYPIESQDSGLAHYTFDEKALRDIQRLPQTKEDYQVGWFHSHPRFGDPFMSVDDIALHKTNFEKPWYVSCVIGGGQWSLPLGFWRMEGDRLIHIASHYLMMTHATIAPSTSALGRNSDVGEPHRRLVRACVGERPVPEMLSRIRAALAILGESLTDESGAALLLVGGVAAESDGDASPLAFAGLIANAAERVASDSGALAILKRIAEALKPVRFLDDVLLSAFRTFTPGYYLARHGDFVCFADVSETGIILGNLKENTYVRFRYPEGITIRSISFGADGSLWIAADDGRVARAPANQIASFALGTQLLGTMRIEYLQALATPRIRELDVSHNSVVLLADQEVLSFGVSAAVSTVKLEGKASAAPDSVLAPRFDGSRCGLVEKRGAEIQYRFDALGESRPYQLPNGLSQYRLTAACVCSLGLALLLVDDSGDAIVILDTAKGDIRALLIPETPAAAPLEAITTDAKGRLFVRRGVGILRGADIFLVSLTGSPEPRWFHFSRGVDSAQLSDVGKESIGLEREAD